MQLFPSIIEEVVFWAVVTTLLLETYYLHYVRIHRFKETLTHEDKRNNLRSTIASIFALLVVIPIGYSRIGSLPNWLFYPGISIALLGLILTLYACSVLGRFFSPNVRVRSDHVVVEKGPYRYIRHPMYASEGLMVIGLGLALQSWVVLLVVLASIGVAYGLRIPQEERLLVSRLGNDYVLYMRRTKRIIPYLW